MPTHKKGHDKDKYYHLAKDQGYRSRAAFKLIQINKRFDFLSKSRVLIDLCAAPGGWCQVAAKAMPAGSIVLGVDLLPIKAIRNVKTVVSDITTGECRKLISNELGGWKADVVLCDGAPNIGSSYSKDAYVQNELVLAALKTATDHLVEGGTFCTKVYRSSDYNAIIWVLQQLFEDVQTIKPNSSRSQSSEIFLVCLRYTNPKRIDPKLLDPNHVFKELSTADSGLAKVDVLHKKYDKANKRHRTGYDDDLGVLLTREVSVKSFIDSAEPIRVLTDASRLHFSGDADSQRYREHPRTTEEIVLCCGDLRVLGKHDFKKLLRWRQQMRAINAAATADARSQLLDDDEGNSALKGNAVLSEEEVLAAEIEAYRLQRYAELRRGKKQERRETAKERSRQSLGMTNNLFDAVAGQEDTELFSVSRAVGEVSGGRLDMDFLLDRKMDEVSGGEEGGMQNKNLTTRKINQNDKRVSVEHLNLNDDEVEALLESELEADYHRFLVGRRAFNKACNTDLADSDALKLATKEGDIGLGRSVKRARRALNSSVAVEYSKSSDSALNKHLDEGGAPHALSAYVELLRSGGGATKERFKKVDDKDNSHHSNEESDSSDEDDVSCDDSGDTQSMESCDAFNNDEALDDTQKMIIEKDRGGVSQLDSVVAAGQMQHSQAEQERASKWFSNPMFALSSLPLADMPKTDREQRREKRRKDIDRRDFRAERKKNRAAADVEADDDDNILQAGLISVNKKSSKEENLVSGGEKGIMSFDIVPVGYSSRNEKKSTRKAEESNDSSHSAKNMESGEKPRLRDDRNYDSDDEDYDQHDRAMTLALGTMMLRHSKKKALVDASYNRFAWNDPKGLPSWFVDDEMRHNKPQLPVPAALLEQIKSRYQSTGRREIKKVAEARDRKKKRVVQKLKAAKKQANAMAENSELSERQKLKAIAKAMKDNKIDKPGKVYVVTHKTKAGSSGSSSGGKGKIKFVDKRMKKDARAVKASEKRSKKHGRGKSNKRH